MLSDLLIAIVVYALGYVIRFAALRRGGGFRLSEISRGVEANTFRALEEGDDDFRAIGDEHAPGGPVCWVCGQPKARGTHTDCR